MNETDEPQRLEVQRPDQLAALTSPVRLELLELFGIWGPCSIAAVAEHAGRPADSLYYHVRKLVSVGLLERSGQQSTGRRSEAVYRLPVETIEVPRRPKSERGRELTHRAVDALLRLAGRELKASLEDEEAVDEGPTRTLYGRRLRARLSKPALRDLNRHVTAIEEIFARAVARKSRIENSVAVTLVITPSTRKAPR